MKFNIVIVSFILIGSLSCDQEPTGPETNCDLLPIYRLEYHFLKAAKVFDVRTDPPSEIINGTLEYDLSYQWWFLHDKVPVLYPYPEYFIDSIDFVSQSQVDIKFYESKIERRYDFVRTDCQIELASPEGNLHLELTQSGEEITESRFAIYDHRSRRVTIDTLSFLSDTFLFLEFRLGPFATYEEIIRQFALDHPGQYDTIAIEQVENRTKE